MNKKNDLLEKSKWLHMVNFYTGEGKSNIPWEMRARKLKMAKFPSDAKNHHKICSSVQGVVEDFYNTESEQENNR